MRQVCFVGVAAAVGAIAGRAAGVMTYTFFDPGAGPEITYTEGAGSFLGNGTSNGLLVWSGPSIALTIDGTDHGLGSTLFGADLTMQLEIGAVSSFEGGILTAPIVSGVITFTDSVTTDFILSGTIGAGSGAVLTLGTTGNVIAQGAGGPGGLVWTAGSALTDAFGPLTLLPIHDMNFTLTEITPTVGVNPDGFLTSFTASSAFTGNSAIPAPGGLALLAVAGVFARRRR